MIISSIKYYIAILLLSFTAINTSASACEGDDLDVTLNIIYESLILGYQAGLTGNYENLFTRMGQLSQQVMTLPDSCQVLVKEVGDELQPVYKPSSTQCSGSVCCDGSGCYSG